MEQINELKKWWNIFQNADDYKDKTAASFEVTSLIHDLKSEMTYVEISDATGIKLSIVKERGKNSSLPQGLKKNHNRPLTEKVINIIERTLDEDGEISDETEYSETQAEANYTPRYYDPKEETDQALWDEALAELRQQDYMTGFVFGDTHIPDQDEIALECTYKLIQATKPDYLILNGDFFDYEAISRWKTTPDKQQQDIQAIHEEPFIQMMARINKIAPTIPKVFIVGNHDGRFWDYLIDTAPGFTNQITRSFIDLIRNNGVMWLGLDNITMDITDNLIITHGADIAFSRAKIFADRILNDFDCDVITNHHHRIQTIMGGKRKVKQVHGAGCLCNLIPSYSKRKTKINQSWQHGVLIVTTDNRNNKNYIENIHIQNGIASYGGRLYTA